MRTQMSVFCLVVIIVFCFACFAACISPENAELTGAIETLHINTASADATPAPSNSPEETQQQVAVTPYVPIASKRLPDGTIEVRVETAEEMEAWAETADASGLYNHNVILTIAGNIDWIPWYSIEDCAAVHTVVLEEGNTIMEDNTSSSCIHGHFEKVVLPSTIDTISPPYVLGRIQNIELSAENPHFKMIDGILYDNKMEVVYYANCDITVAQLSNTVLKIEVLAFADCSLLTTIDLPDSVEYIYSHAFENCTLLSEVSLPPNLQYLGGSAFRDTPALRKLYIPKGIDFSLVDDFEGALFQYECGLQSIVCEGTNLQLDKSIWLFGFPPEQITQLVFLSEQPLVVDSDYITGFFPNATVYYLSKNKKHWAPKGETEWNGMPLVAIKSLEDLPPVE